MTLFYQVGLYAFLPAGITLPAGIFNPHQKNHENTNDRLAIHPLRGYSIAMNWYRELRHEKPPEGNKKKCRPHPSTAR